MSAKIAINGLGRIGRLALRAYLDQPEKYPFEIVAANDLVPGDNLAYLMKYDSVHGRFKGDVKCEGNQLFLNGHTIQLESQADPKNLPWQSLGVDLVLECTGLFRRIEDAGYHQTAGAKKVIISAPAESAHLTMVMGVNHHDYKADEHHIVSNASCTTNSLAPPLKVLNDAFGIDQVMATTVHAYTMSQGIVDKPSRKMIRGRAGAVNIIPTSTGSDKATALVIPELQGKIFCTALRIPVPDGAITDITVNLAKNVTESEINERLNSASEGVLKGILEFTNDEIVSSDILGNSHSAIVHGLATKVVAADTGCMAKIQVWYDNEYGYACRLLDAATHMLS